MFKQNQMRENTVYKNTPEFTLCWATALGYGACPEE